ncbi:MAG TPA: acyl carrier protein [Xanthobacteraceae bacterium]|nr:acyl carrier protein [Xanthobacteraceae bacterium]
MALVGDGDDLDVIYDVERAFGIKLTDAEAERVRNVGELHDLMELKLLSADTRACLSQAAFYRLRKGLRSMGVQTEIRPETPISILEGIQPRSISRKWKDLSLSSALELPSLETPMGRWLPERGEKWVRGLVYALLSASGLYLAILMHSITGLSKGWAIILVLLAALVLGVSIHYLWHQVFGNIPRRIHTVGDLAREAAGYSFEKLAADKSGSSPFDRWFALSAILRRISGHKRPITRDTTFMSEHAKPTG